MIATPGGHVDDGESFEEAAIREFHEETGLTGKNPKEILHNTYRGYDSKT